MPALLTTEIYAYANTGGIFQEIRGDGLSYQGSWMSAGTYVPFQVVEYSASNYVCIRGHTAQTPTTAYYWSPLARIGPGTPGSLGVGSGSLVAPGLASSAYSDVGFYWPASNAIAVVSNGTEAMRWTDSAITAAVPLEFSGTHGGIRLINLTTAQRDEVTAAAGHTIWNTDLGTGQWYTGSAWESISTSNQKTASVDFIFYEGGGALTTGLKGYIEVPFACTISRVTLLADQVGSMVIDIWKDTYANHPPTVADTITAAAKPTLSSAVKSQDAVLTGWTLDVAAGDIFAFNIDSSSTITRATLILKVTKT